MMSPILGPWCEAHWRLPLVRQSRARQALVARPIPASGRRLRTFGLATPASPRESTGYEERLSRAIGQGLAALASDAFSRVRNPLWCESRPVVRSSKANVRWHET